MVEKPLSETSKNQIDFALFAKQISEKSEQYFDVIGSYSNGYKDGETENDYQVIL